MGISNGHAARMRFSRFKKQMEQLDPAVSGPAATSGATDGAASANMGGGTTKGTAMTPGTKKGGKNDGGKGDGGKGDGGKGDGGKGTKASAGERRAKKADVRRKAAAQDKTKEMEAAAAVQAEVAKLKTEVEGFFGGLTPAGPVGTGPATVDTEPTIKTEDGADGGVYVKQEDEDESVEEEEARESPAYRDPWIANTLRMKPSSVTPWM